MEPSRSKSLFLAASELNESDRAAFLDRECRGDDGLRAEVEALLRANDLSPAPAIEWDENSATLDSSSNPPTVDQIDPTAQVGSLLAGKYKLAEEIGAGGMGSVYLAQQTEPVQRSVAVKVVKAGMDSKEVLARFAAERQALALMDHPNIAKVHDAGTTEGGRPFFVMELVKGTPITQFCDERRLSPRERLELFIPVCQAIQHAHLKGIIHRDIKPSNVLVGMYDDRAIPKVIDFGVAKAAGPALTEHSMMTGFGAVIGTPEYMSPEQAQLNNLDIDSRSDVYSLGVLLYELLTGTTPVDRKSLGKAAVLEILRIVREVDAPRPSDKLSTTEALPSIASNRAVEPARLSKLLAGELDWVLLKALDKDRTRRYETANGLAQDIQRYLADEVVEARPPSSAYRLKKFVRQNKGKVIAASLVLFALLAGIAGTSYGLFKAEKARELADTRREEAEEQRGRAEAGEQLAQDRLVLVEEEKAIAAAVSDFLQNKLLGQASVRAQTTSLMAAGLSGEESKINPTIRELLDRAAKELAESKIEESFPDQPRLQAELLATVGFTYFGVGDAKTAIGFLECALALNKEHLEVADLRTLETMGNLTLAYLDAGFTEKGFRLAKEALELFRNHHGMGNMDSITSLGNLGRAHQIAGRTEEAVKILKETYELNKKHLPPGHRHTIVSMSNLAFAYDTNKQTDKAIPLYKQALEEFRAEFGPKSPEALTCLSNLATAYMQSGDLQRALPMLEQSLELRKAKFGEKGLDTLQTMNNLARAYSVTGQIQKALPLAKRTLEILREKVGTKRIETQKAMAVLADIHRTMGQRNEAMALMQEMYEEQKASIGLGHPEMVMTISNLTILYQETGQVEEAVTILKEALEEQTSELGKTHPGTLGTMSNLVSAYAASGQREKAIKLADEALAVAKAKLDAGQPEMVEILHNLGVSYWRMRELDKSVPIFEQLLKFCEPRMQRKHPKVRQLVADLGINYKDANRLDEAIPLLEETFQTGKTDPKFRWAIAALLEVCQKSKNYKKGWSIAKEQVAEGRRLLPPESPHLAGILAVAAQFGLDAKAYKESEPLIRECLKIREQAIPDSWLFFNTQSMLGGALLGQKKYEEAEPLLVAGHKGMSEREDSIPAQGQIRITQSLQRLVNLYTALKKPKEAEKWQAKLDERMDNSSEPN